MTQTVTVQAVAGAIRATKGVTKSHKYKSSSRSVRSCGVYATKRFNGEIELDYWTSGYKHHADRSVGELALVIATLESKGFEVIEKLENSWGLSIQTKHLIVVSKEAVVA